MCKPADRLWQIFGEMAWIGTLVCPTFGSLQNTRFHFITARYSLFKKSGGVPTHNVRRRPLCCHDSVTTNYSRLVLQGFSRSIFWFTWCRNGQFFCTYLSAVFSPPRCLRPRPFRPAPRGSRAMGRVRVVASSVLWCLASCLLPGPIHTKQWYQI